MFLHFTGEHIIEINSCIRTLNAGFLARRYPRFPEVLDELEKGNIGSQSPHHPNNILAGQHHHHHHHHHHHRHINNSARSVAANNAISATANITVIPSDMICTTPSKSTASSASSQDSAPSAEDVQVSLVEITPSMNEKRHTLKQQNPVRVKLESGASLVLKPELKSEVMSTSHDGAVTGGVASKLDRIQTLPEGEELTVLDSSLLDPAFADISLPVW